MLIFIALSYSQNVERLIVSTICSKTFGKTKVPKMPILDRITPRFFGMGTKKRRPIIMITSRLEVVPVGLGNPTPTLRVSCSIKLS